MNNFNNATYLHSDLTGKIIKAALHVHNHLGYGFLERVYENSLLIQLRKMGFSVRQQERIDVFFEDNLVGNYIADLVVEERVIIEIKATKEMHSRFEVQLVNYLRATQIEVGLLLNCSDSLKVKRRVFTNNLKVAPKDQ